MPIAITRFFDDLGELNSVSRDLVQDKGLPRHIVRAFQDADRLVDALTAEGVESATVEAYRARMEQGGAVLLVLADYTPLGVAQITRDVFAASGAADMGDLTEEVKTKFVPSARRSVLQGNPLMLTRRQHDPYRTNFFMADRPIPHLIKKQQGPEPLIPLHGRMASWPIDLLLPSSRRFGRFPFDLLVPGHKFMAKFPFGHIVPGHKFMAKFPFAHIVPGHKFMANFPIGHLIPGHKFMAKFPFGHLVPGHRRMANWPFPLLMNGKFHKVPLMLGDRFMAKSPIDHLVPGHKFMANFPIGHLIPGHKFMAKFPFGHIVPGHKYMANWILPHTRTEAV